VEAETKFVVRLHGRSITVVEGIQDQTSSRPLGL
jgi:hypothetical protein